MPRFSLATALRGVSFRAWIFCIALFAISLHAAPIKIEGLGKGAVPLDGAWQFHLGDNLGWAAPGLNDATGQNGWEEIRADDTWGSQGHFAYSGFAWYRKQIEVTTAPGAPKEISLLIPAIDDAYEVYWNGKLVGGLGTLPPHLVMYNAVPPQIFSLGKETSGTLAIRVFKAPLATNDDGTLGGFEGVPRIGGAAAIAAAADSSNFAWLRGSVVMLGMSILYALVAGFSFLAWWRDRSRPLLLWMAVFAICPILQFLLTRTHWMLSYAHVEAVIQTLISIREVSQWFVLVWLLELQEDRTLMRALRWLGIFLVIAGFVDGVSLLFYPWLISASGFQIWDAVATFPLVVSEPIPAVLGVIALFRGRKLGFSRWLVAALAIANALYYSVSNISGQGMRFTHWTLAALLLNAHFSIAGIGIGYSTALYLLLFLAIAYAVVLYARDELQKSAQLAGELESARELQQVLVPETQPAIPGFTLTSSYIPAREVGGDFYQILPRPDGSTMIVLGDVSGKGLRAAMAVSLIVGAIRTLAEATQSPAALLAGLNKQLIGRLQGGFATCIALRLDADGNCTLASAGHPAPFVSGREVELPGALPVGVAADAAYTEQTIRLDAGSHLALYTDGLVEARKPTGELYGFARLKELFTANSTAAEASEAAVSFGQDDDITVLTLAREGVSPAKTASAAPELSPSPA